MSVMVDPAAQTRFQQSSQIFLRDIAASCILVNIIDSNLSLKTQGQLLSWEELQLQQQPIISSSTRSILASKFTKFTENVLLCSHLGTSTSNISNVTTTIIPVFATPLGSRGSYWYTGGSILLSSDIDTTTITAAVHYRQQHHNSSETLLHHVFEPNLSLKTRGRTSNPIERNQLAQSNTEPRLGVPILFPTTPFTRPGKGGSML